MSEIIRNSFYLNTGARHHVSVDNHWFGGEKLIEEVFIQIDGFYYKVIRTVTSCGGLGGNIFNTAQI